MDTLDIFTKSLFELNNAIAVFLPRLALAAALLIVGWIVARFLRALVGQALKLVKLDVAAEKSGIASFLVKGGVRLDAISLVTNVVYWLAIFVVALTALNTLGLQMVTELFSKTMLYIPNVIVAVLVIIFGSIIARLTQTVLIAYLNNVGIGASYFVGKLAQYAILAFVAFVALEQLSIGGEILVSAFQISFGGICLAAAIAFGFGGKTLAGKILDKAWEEMHRK